MKKKHFIISIAPLVLLLLLLAMIGTAAPSPSWWNVYKTNIIKQPVMKELCIDEKQEANGTFHPEYCYGYLDHYREKEVQTGKVIGITNGCEIIYNARIKKGKKHIWQMPIGDRNMEDPTLGKGCREYEIRKGVCKVV